MILRSEDHVRTFKVIVFRVERRRGRLLCVRLIQIHAPIVADSPTMALVLSTICWKHSVDQRGPQDLAQIGVGIGLSI